MIESEVRTVFRANPIPVPGAAVDLVYFPALLDGTPDFWTIRLYRDNLAKFGGSDQVAIASRVAELIVKCRQVHPRVYHEVLEKEPA